MFASKLLIILSIQYIWSKKLVGKNDTHSYYLDYHKYTVESFNSRRLGWKTSALGSVLFKNTSVASITRSRKKKYVILLWKNAVEGINLNGCSVKNCVFVRDKIHLPAADAVVVNLIIGHIPQVSKRNPKQRWVFLTREPPTKTFILTNTPPKLSDLANVFNWSMSYRTDSDVPAPFGRTILLRTPKWSNISFIKNNVPYWKNKKRNVLAAVLMSCCHYPKRMEFLRVLKKHLRYDFYGKCSEDHKYTCPGDFHNDCKILSRYLFYLALENSRCPQYLSEKIFYNGYYKGAIPVILGPSLADCEKLLPPNSYLHVDSFKNVAALAKKIKEISKDDKKILSYHSWRNHFEVSNEHGYFGSKPFHWCRICEAMNYNDASPSVYTEDDLRLFLDPNVLCQW